MDLRLTGFVAVLATGMWYACSNDLKINAPFTETTFVYGLLDIGDSVHYLRIQRSFLNEDSTPYELIGDVYSYRYEEDELEVWVEAWKNDAQVATYPFEYILGDTVGLALEDGLFEPEANVLYRFTGQLDSTAEYRLFIHRWLQHDTITAVTKPVSSFQVLFPVAFLYGINLTDTFDVIYVNTYATNAQIYDLVMRFRYREINLTTGDTSELFADWPLATNQTGDNLNGLGVMAYEVKANLFYAFVAAELGVDPAVRREFVDLQYRFYAGGEELYWQYLNELATLGFQELYATTMYTNVRGGYGIFSSRRLQVSDSIQLSDQSLDTLACGYRTFGLGFPSSTANPFYPGCE